MGMRDYQNLKDIIIPEAQEKIMDICCASWDDCRDMGHCKDCPDRQMLKEKFSLLECFSLKYSRMLIEAGYAPVVHGEWTVTVKPIGDSVARRFINTCSVCGSKVEFLYREHRYEYCPHCGAKMDGGESND